MPATDVGIFGINPLSKVYIQQAVDPSFMAARVAMKPLDFAGNGLLLGHYAVAQSSGTTLTITAAQVIASMRWTNTSNYLVLMRICAGYNVNTAVTTATTMDLKATIARGFTVDYSSNNTKIDLSTVTDTNMMRSGAYGMGPSLMGASGPQICTTSALAGQTLTSDTAPFATMVWPSIYSTNVAGTAVAMPIGMSGGMQELYNWRNLGQHPIVLGANEGIILGPATAGPITTGGVLYYVQWEWAEVQLF